MRAPALDSEATGTRPSGDAGAGTCEAKVANPFWQPQQAGAPILVPSPPRGS